MKLKELRFRLYAAPLIVSLAISTAIAVQVSREQGDSLQRKFDEIAKNASSDPVRPKRTPMSELEVASYLAFNVKDKIPRGLTNPEISMLGGIVPLLTASVQFRFVATSGIVQLDDVYSDPWKVT